MTIGKHAPQIASDTDFCEAVRIGLDEALTALEESFHDLTDEQVTAFAVEGHNNMAWLILHCLNNLDANAVGIHSPAGVRVLEADPRWDLWRARLRDQPKPGDALPTVEAMLEMLHQIREQAMALLTGCDAAWLREPVGDHPQKPVRADFYMRTIYHTMAHTRDLWLLRGALGLADGPWPQQHWA